MSTSTISYALLIRLSLVVVFGCILANSAKISAPYIVQVSQLNVPQSQTIKRPSQYISGTEYSKFAAIK